MPFRSQAQQRFAFGTHQSWADRWAKETDFSKLPKYVRRRRKMADVCTCKATGAPGEKLAPGITRIRGNLCNVHGKYGPCDAGASAKPRKGRARKPPKPKQTPEQRAQARTQQRQASFDKVAQQMADSDTGLSPGGTKALLAFAQGQPPDARTAEGLSKMGLAERAEDGSYRMTPTGRAVVSAMQAGDYQRAIDAISRGTDTATRRGERQTAAQGRQQVAAQRRADVEARRVQRAQERAARQAAKKPAKSGGKQPEKQQAQPRKSQSAQRRSGRSGSAPSVGSVGGGSKPKPKPVEAAPKPEKTEPTIAPALQDAADKLSSGAELTEDEQQALIRNGLAKLNKDGTLILTAAGQRATKKETSGHTGVMIALYPDAAAAKAIAAQDGVTEPIDGLHLTLAFMGDSTETALATNKDRIVEAVQQWAVEHGQSLEGTINGLGRFFHSEDDDTNAVYVAPDVPGLPELRQSLVDWIEQSGFDYAQNHGFTPHITVAYVPLDAPTPPIRIETPVRFDHVTLAWGDERYDYPLGALAQKSLSVFKDASGGDRWLMVSSTAYRDRDKEIVSTQALNGAVAQADASGMRGPLRFWHVPGLDLGDCDYQATAQDGRFLIESGTFRSPALAAAVKAHADEYQSSIGFIHPATEPDADGVYRNITIFERSLVPKGRAANPLTRVVITKELRMLTPEKEAQLKSLTEGDPTLLADLLSRVASTDKAAQDAGMAYKDDLRALFREELAALLTEKAAPPVEVAPPDEPPVEAKADMGEMADEAGGEMMAEDAMDYLGDMSIDDFRALLSQAFADAIAPLVKSIDIAGKMAGQIDELKGMMGGYTATKDAAQAELKTELETVKAAVADLSGSQPRILAGGFRASQSSATITTDETKIKEAGPAADPKAAAFGAFMQDLGFTGPVQGV